MSFRAATEGSAVPIRGNGTHVIDIFQFFRATFCYSFDASMCNRSNYIMNHI